MKNLEKRNKLIISLFFVIILFTGIIIGYILSKKSFKNKCESCNNVVNIYDIEPIIKNYGTYNNQNVYLYNVNDIKLNYKNEDITLKDYLNIFNDNLDNAFNNLLNELQEVKVLNDGGTKVYQSKNNSVFKDSDITIIKCHTLDGNNDLYIGKYYEPLNAFKNGACGKNFFSDVEFSRVYTIKNIKDISDVETEKENIFYLELTIMDDNNNETIIKEFFRKEIRDTLVENKKYKFIFSNRYGELIKEDISEIFNKCSLNNVILFE